MNTRPDDPTPAPGTDLQYVLEVVRRRLGVIVLTTLVVTALTALWLLSRPVVYSARATFHDKGSSKPAIGGGGPLAALMLNLGGSSDNRAMSVLKSRSLMEKLLDRQGLQLQIEADSRRPSLLGSIVDNALSEYAWLARLKRPLVRNDPPALRASGVAYREEGPLSMRALFRDEEHYDLIVDGELCCAGRLGVPVRHDKGRFAFTLHREKDAAPLTGQSFSLTLWPREQRAEDLNKALVVMVDKDDKTLLHLKWRYHNRHTVARAINELMALYKEYLEDERQRLMQEQIRYLRGRKEEVAGNVESKMHSFAGTLSDDFISLGSIDTQRAMEFLSTCQNSIRSKQMAITLEMERLRHAQGHDRAPVTALLMGGETPQAHNIAALLQDYQHQYDTIHIALSGQRDGGDDYEALLHEQMDKLHSLSLQRGALQQVVKAVQDDAAALRVPKALQQPTFLVAQWVEGRPAGRGDDYRLWKEQFLSYLKNVDRHLQVYSKAVAEQLSQQHPVVAEEQGIDLSIAKELYIALNSDMNNLEAQLAQQQFILEKLATPQFEISTLSSTLNDPVGQELVANAAALLLALKDQSNRSQREQERLTQELALQRSFLVAHLQQSRDLLVLRHRLLESKRRSLQKTTLMLLQQQIGILEKQLADLVDERLASLQREQQLLEGQQEELRRQMQRLPEKWVAEQLIHQEMEVNRQMAKEITNLVETKNISNNLEVVQSAPVDSALVPLHPDPPYALFGSVLAAAAACLGAIGVSILRGARR